MQGKVGQVATAQVKNPGRPLAGSDTLFWGGPMLSLITATLVSFAAAHTTESQTPWTRKCESQEEYFGFNCQKPEGDSVFKNCFGNKKHTVSVRTETYRDAVRKGMTGCQVYERRPDGETKREIFFSNGTREVEYIKDGVVTNYAIYTKDGMIACENKPDNPALEEADKNVFKWCGFSDPRCPSTDKRPYCEVTEAKFNHEIRNGLLAGTKTFRDLVSDDDAQEQVRKTPKAAVAAPADPGKR